MVLGGSLEGPNRQDLVEAFDCHAAKIDGLEHESMQVNDDIAFVIDGHLQAAKASEVRMQDQIRIAFADGGLRQVCGAQLSRRHRPLGVRGGDEGRGRTPA